MGSHFSTFWMRIANSWDRNFWDRGSDFRQPSVKPKEFKFANRILIYALDQKLKHSNLAEIIKCSELLKALNSDDLV